MSSKKACERKIKYSKAEATAQLKLRNSAKGFHGGSVYHCQWCGKYHISHQAKNSIPESVWRKISYKKTIAPKSDNFYT